MSFQLTRWPIRAQVLSALLVAVVALVGISAAVVLDSWRTMRMIGELQTLANTVNSIGALTHELQKERGATALFIASKGSQFRAELDAQRQNSDKARNVFRDAVAPLRNQPAFTAFLEEIVDAEMALASLGSWRGDIDALRVDSSTPFANYTRIISGLLDAGYEISRKTEDSELKNLVFAYVALMQGKEMAGRERATGAAGFAAGRFDPDLYRRLVSLITSQSTHFAVFEAMAPIELVERFRHEMEGPSRGAVDAMRQIALDAGIGGDAGGVAASEWFRAATDRIDRVRVVEAAISATLTIRATVKGGAASSAFIGVLSLACAASGVAIIIGLLVVRSMARILGGLTSATTRIANGDIHATIPGEDRTDELGALARSIHAIRNAGVAAMRVKTALDNVSANTMMANTAGEIIYLNKAVLEMFRAAETDIRRQLPGFAADRLLGSNIDSWHRDPAMQRALLSRLDQPHRTRIKIGGRDFDLIATPVIDEQGERHGSVAEWRDVTQELRIEREVAGMVAAAAAGDFSHTVDLVGKQGFMLDLARSMNALGEASERSLCDIAGFLERLAGGDLSARIAGDHEGMYAKIRDDANRTAERLAEVVSRIIEAAETISTASAEISAGSGDLAERTEQQASSLEETAASMEELSATVRSTADKAVRASATASGARETAQTGASVANSAADAMQRIEEASRRITDIIGVMDEIAFQTNLLALNAAVEAARAGDAGRGFAVVAQEVRQLAQRSAQASKEIKALILDSDGQVRDGVERVNRAGAALGGIVADVQQVAELIADMAAASTEQAAALEQVNATVAQMDEMTQKNAAMVEETTAAANALAGQADDLRQLVSFFRS